MGNVVEKYYKKDMANTGYVSIGHLTRLMSDENKIQVLRDFCKVLTQEISDSYINKDSLIWAQSCATKMWTEKNCVPLQKREQPPYTSSTSRSPAPAANTGNHNHKSLALVTSGVTHGFRHFATNENPSKNSRGLTPE